MATAPAVAVDPFWELHHTCPGCRVIDYLPLGEADRTKVRCLRCGLVYRRRWALLDPDRQDAEDEALIDSLETNRIAALGDLDPPE